MKKIVRMYTIFMVMSGAYMYGELEEMADRTMGAEKTEESVDQRGINRPSVQELRSAFKGNRKTPTLAQPRVVKFADFVESAGPEVKIPTESSKVEDPKGVAEKAAVDAQAKENVAADMSGQDLEDTISRNIDQRVNFRNLVMDRAAYRREIRQKIDQYANDMAEKLSLNLEQKNELRLALSKGLMDEQELLVSVGRTLGAGALGAAAVGDAFIGGVFLAGSSSAIDLRGTDARVFDYRSTTKRLTDVITRPPFDELDIQLKLSTSQIAKLNEYRETVIKSFDHQARTLYDDIRHVLGRRSYDVIRFGIMLAVVALIIDLAVTSK